MRGDGRRQFVLAFLGGIQYLFVFGRVLRKLWRDADYRSLGQVARSFDFYEGCFGQAAVEAMTRSMTVLDMQHFTLTYNFFHVFRCTDNFVSEMPDIRCESRVHKQLVAGSSLLFVIAVIGVPSGVRGHSRVLRGPSSGLRRSPPEPPGSRRLR